MTDERIKAIANKNGTFGVLAKLEEELLEAHEALLEYMQDPVDPDLENHLAEELTDVSIVIEQMGFKFGLADSFEKWREFKINRTLERLNV